LPGASPGRLEPPDVYFLSNLRLCPISKSVCHGQAFLA